MTRPATRWLVFAGALLAAAALSLAAARHGVAQYWEGTANPSMWLRAAELEPSNADNWYRLGRYRQLDFENGDLKLAVSYYHRAVLLNPHNAAYWLDLAGAYEATGDFGQAEQAYRTARKDYPISAVAAWGYGNFLLRQNRTQEAFQQIHDALEADPAMTELAVSRCWRGTQDIDGILKFALPAEPETYWGAIQFFVNAAEPDAAMAVWKQLAAQKTSFAVSKAFPLVDLLISTDHPADAVTVWQQALAAANIAAQPAPGGSLIWNGGFERELLDGGFAWRYRPTEGATFGLDDETIHSGGQSLRVDFDGTANLDFRDIWQVVAVQPDTAYRFSAYLRTDSLSTESGIFFEITDIDGGTAVRSTTGVVDTQPWTLGQLSFVTGPKTRLLRIALRRRPSTMLSNKIRGTVWADDVSLFPGSSPAAP